MVTRLLQELARRSELYLEKTREMTAGAGAGTRFVYKQIWRLLNEVIRQLHQPGRVEGNEIRP